MRLAIYGNKYQEGHIEGLSRFFNALANCDVQVAMEYTFYNYLCRVLPSPPRVEDIIKGDNFSADLAISIGGDDTFLRTAQWVGSKNIPIMLTPFFINPIYISAAPGIKERMNV